MIFKHTCWSGLLSVARSSSALNSFMSTCRACTPKSNDNWNEFQHSQNHETAVVECMRQYLSVLCWYLKGKSHGIVVKWLVQRQQRTVYTGVYQVGGKVAQAHPLYPAHHTLRTPHKHVSVFRRTRISSPLQLCPIVVKPLQTVYAVLQTCPAQVNNRQLQSGLLFILTQPQFI